MVKFRGIFFLLCLCLVGLVATVCIATAGFVIDDFEDGNMTWELMEDQWATKGTDRPDLTTIEIEIVDGGATSDSRHCLEFRVDLNSAFATITRVFDNSGVSETSASEIKFWLKATENVRIVILEIQEDLAEGETYGTRWRAFLQPTTEWSEYTITARHVQYLMGGNNRGGPRDTVKFDKVVRIGLTLGLQEVDRSAITEATVWIDDIKIL